ncbi:hypothetical protein [Streptosporangium vulgare]|uniref:hypothetical protein n=1 Tax=Streptosporangium vulgare TaxID=46190 RepID=UPI0031DF5364
MQAQVQAEDRDRGADPGHERTLPRPTEKTGEESGESGDDNDNEDENRRALGQDS